MKAYRFLILSFSLLAFLTVGEVDADEFYETIRDLIALQNQIAFGDMMARDLAAKKLNEIEQALPSYPPALWSDARNEKAIPLYLLNGGSTTALRRIFDRNVFSAENTPLIAASLVYAEGHGQAALSSLQELNLKAYSPILRAHLALIKGGLLIGIDSSKAAEALDYARLLMPQSLVEEAALRREIGIIDPLRQAEKLILLSERYSTSYLASPFANRFWTDLIAIAIKASLEIDAEEFSAIETLLQNAPSSGRLELYLGIIRNALLHNRLDLATSHVARAQLIAQTSNEKNRLKLYSVGLEILAGKFDQGAAHIREIETSTLSGEDSEVRDVLIAIASETRKTESSKNVRPIRPAMPVDRRAESSGTTSPIVDEVERSLASAGALLKKAAGK